MNVYCVFSLESPHRGDSSAEYTKYIIYNKKKENYPKLFQTETAVVNEPSVIEVLNFFWFAFDTLVLLNLQQQYKEI